MQAVPIDGIVASQACNFGVLTCAALGCVGAPQVKMHWVHENYWQPGPQGNDIQKTNVPNLRMRFRYDNHQEEVRLQSRPGDYKAESLTYCLLCLVFLCQQDCRALSRS